jgi:L-threonylcarbamoyladenylate synthase
MGHPQRLPSASASGFAGTITAALEALRNSLAVVYPTETLYALGVRAFDQSALELLVRLKVRAPGKPVSVLVANTEMLDRLVEEVSPAAERLIERFWPGPLTLALPARRDVPEILTGGRGSIGVRVSSHPVANELVALLNEPLTAPSANPAGARPPSTVAAAQEYFGDAVAYYVDWGPTAGEPASTVLEVVADSLRLIREGTIPAAAIQAVSGLPVIPLQPNESNP